MSEQETKVTAVAPSQEAAANIQPVDELVMEKIMCEHTEQDPVTSTKLLLQAGSHFGHQTKRWNPKMKKYIFGARNGIYIIDLVKTSKKLQEAYLALKKIVANGGKVLFVGTKKQAKDIIAEEAIRSGSFYVNNRWLGGIITNFQTIKGRIARLKELEQKEVDGLYDLMPKKEAILEKKLQATLASNLSGIKEMRKTPDAVIVVDPTAEHNAVLEARKKHIPVFAIVDTNCDPDEVDYVIPANDDATKSIKLLVGILADAVVEAKGGNPAYAYFYNSVDGAVVEMDEALQSVDKTEEIKLIRQKAREDNFSSKKKGPFVQKKRFFDNKDPKAQPVAEKKEAEAK